MADADDLSAICVLCKFDIETLDNGVLKKLELKSYSVGTIGNMSNSPQFKNQFKAYLVEANGISDFEYIFNGMKTQNLTLIKENFQSIFTNKATDIYNSFGVTKFEQMFGVDNVSDFLDSVVSDLNGSIYSFIKIN